MNALQLRASVAALGLLSQLDEEQEHAFIPAVNRALKQITTELPIIGQVQIAHLPITPAVYDRNVRLRHSGETHSYTHEHVRAFTFEIQGYGSLKISDKSGHVKTVEIGNAQAFRSYKYLLHDLYDDNAQQFDDPADLTIEFSGATEGETRYLLRNVAIYTEISSFDVDDLRVCGERTAYDVAEIAGSQFGGIAGAIRKEGCESDTAPDVIVEYDSIVSIKTCDMGVYTVPIYVIPDEITHKNLADEIPVDHRYSHLLELLTAFYLWTEEDPAQANQYLTLYYSELTAIKQKRRLGRVSPAGKKNGW